MGHTGRGGHNHLDKNENKNKQKKEASNYVSKDVVVEIRQLSDECNVFLYRKCDK